jgi:hypothetical protein
MNPLISRPQSGSYEPGRRRTDNKARYNDSWNRFERVRGEGGIIKTKTMPTPKATALVIMKTNKAIWRRVDMIGPGHVGQVSNNLQVLLYDG